MSASLTHVGSAMAEVTLAHRTRTYQALDFRFEVRTSDPIFAQVAERIFADLPPPAADHRPHVVFTVLDPSETDDGGFRLLADDDVVLESGDAGRITSRLMWHINQQVIAHASDRVLVHAAGATKDGVGVLLPAAMEAGKTTLVAGLVRAGFGYLSDESIAIDRDGRHLHGYPKPLSVDQGSWEVLAHLAPADDGGGEYLSRQWQVPAGALRPSATVTDPVPARYIVVPRYEAGASTVLEPLSRAHALRLLAEQTFATGLTKRDCFATAAALVRRCDCYRLTVNDLDEACALLIGVLEDDG